MILDPKHGDIVYLCPEADVSRFIYYSEDESKRVRQRYKKLLAMFAKGASGVVDSLAVFDQRESETVHKFGYSKYAVWVKIRVREGTYPYDCIYFPEWMLANQPFPGYMSRDEITNNPRKM